MRLSLIRSRLSFSVLIAALQCLLLDYVSSLQCFVCDTETTSTLSCDNFDPSNNIFAKECPIDSSGSCSVTKKDGKITSRSCEQFPLDDCETANNVEYCYCRTNLCNRNAHMYLENSDDEDAIEGSGLRSTTSAPVKVILPVNHPKSSSFQVKLCNFLILLQYFVILSVL